MGQLLNTAARLANKNDAHLDLVLRSWPRMGNPCLLLLVAMLSHSPWFAFAFLFLHSPHLDGPQETSMSILERVSHYCRVRGKGLQVGLQGESGVCVAVSVLKAGRRLEVVGWQIGRGEEAEVLLRQQQQNNVLFSAGLWIEVVSKFEAGTSW